MSKIKNIVQGHYNLATNTTIKDEKKRLEACASCEFKNNSPKYWCKFCSCNMPAKIKAPGAKCPKNKW